MSFHERTLWLMFVVLAAVFGFYFFAVLPPASSRVTPGHVGLFVLVVVVLVVLNIIGAIVLAVARKLFGHRDGKHDTDERDRIIGLKATRNGAYVLVTGVFLSLCAALITEGNFVFTHLLLFFWVLAQLVETGSQLVLYRRGA